MDLKEIRQHWQSWADQYGTDLRATTKTSTAKAMEIDALARAIKAIAPKIKKGSSESEIDLKVLEVGCGNGQNCFSLLSLFPQSNFKGVDFIEQMIVSADARKSELEIPDDKLTFAVGNVLEMGSPAGDKELYDVIFTDRCLINLNNDELQKQAIANIARWVKPGGYLLMIENANSTYNKQNTARESVGLPKREPAQFNHFFNEDVLMPHLPTVGLNLEKTEDFISLHDLVLYVLVPMTNGGTVDYNHPMVQAATQLNLAISNFEDNSLGQFGQNRLYICRKEK